MKKFDLQKGKIAILLLTSVLLMSACATKTASTSVQTVETAAPAEATVSPAAESAEPAEATVEQTAENAQSSEKFEYIHDPRENEKAMKDIIENPDAVYGFSPDPESTRLGEYASYDWTDPDVVEKAREERIAYEKSFSSMTEMLYTMREEGKSTEEIARAVSGERNRLRLAASENDPESLETAKKSNLETYGNENGPTPEYLYEKYGSWEGVLQHAFNPNMGMDACCGLYDENYSLYQKLGMVE